MSKEKTKKCPDCSEKILASAKRCKYCGADLRSWFARHPIITIVVGGWLFITIISYFSDNSYRLDYKTNNIAPLLEVKSLRTYKENNYAYITGEVQNISNKSLSDIIALGAYYDENSNIVKTSEAPIKYNPILSNQISPFEVLTSDNPEIKNGAVTFKNISGNLIPTRQLNGDVIP